MRSLLVLLVLTSLAATTQAWPSWSDIKQKVSDVTDDIKDGWDEHIDPLFDEAKESWDDHVQPFLDEVAEKAKKFVMGHRENFNNFAATLKEKAAKLDECRDCADSGTCSADKDEECEELYGIFSKVFKFYDCFNEPDTPKCIREQRHGREDGEEGSKSGEEDKSAEKEEDKSVQDDGAAADGTAPAQPPAQPQQQEANPPADAETVIQDAQQAQTITERRARKLLRELLKSNA